MTFQLLLRLLAFACLACALSIGSASAAALAQPRWTINCTQLNKKYSHGVGRATARDRVRGKSAPVTTFKRSNRLYRTAMRWNSDLDRDKDGVACENP
jgi:hypothetical protein